MGVLADARAEAGDARHPLAAAGERDDDLPGVRRREVDALVRAREQLVEHAGERSAGTLRAVGAAATIRAASARAGGRRRRASRTTKPSWQSVSSRLYAVDVLLPSASATSIGAQAVLGAREQREQAQHGARGADAALRAGRGCMRLG